MVDLGEDSKARSSATGFEMNPGAANQEYNELKTLAFSSYTAAPLHQASQSPVVGM